MYYYAQDVSGNVVGLTTSTGAVANQYRYTPWGGAELVQEAVTNNIRFAGRQNDPETGLYYNRARYYDPGVGRFISEDPLGLSAAINGYVYAVNNPVNERDPGGLMSCDDNVKVFIDGNEVPCDEGGNAALAAADAWFSTNYGFDLQDAWNGTNGDCLFSGGGGIYCNAGGSFAFAPWSKATKEIQIYLGSGFERCPLTMRNESSTGDEGTVRITESANGRVLRSYDQAAWITYNVVIHPLTDFFVKKNPKAYRGRADVYGSPLRIFQATRTLYTGPIDGGADCETGAASFSNF